MRSYGEALEPATICARNARISSDKDVARELWKWRESIKPKLPNLIMAGCLNSAIHRQAWKVS
jgi:hypothetical protein